MKPYLALPVLSPSLLRVASRSGAASVRGSRRTESSSRPARESGSLLLFLLPALLLACGALLGSYKLVQLSQQRIAMQARLDICALTLLKKRENFARAILPGNQVIRLTGLAITMARGIKILTGPAGALLGTMGEVALKNLNRVTARIQEVQRMKAQAEEILAMRCAPTPFSKGLAFCRISPLLGAATKREKAWMPDISGALVFKQSLMARVKCQAGNLNTTMRLEGDATLTHKKFKDAYEK